MIKLKTNIFLIIIVSALAVYIFFIDNKITSTDNINSEKLNIWKMENVSKVILKDKEKTFVYNADDEKIPEQDALFNSVKCLRVGRIIENSSEKEVLERYGLLNPEFTLIVQSDDNMANTLFIGDKFPIGEGFYGKVKGDSRIFLLHKNFVEKLRNVKGKQL